MYKKGELLFICLLVFSILILLGASFVAIAKEKEIIENMDSNDLFSAKEEVLLDESLNDTDLLLCRETVAKLVSKYDPFIKGLEKITIHKRLDMRRGLANSKTIQIRCLKDIVEFENIFIHELGHVVDLNFLKGGELDFSDKFILFGSPISLDDPSIRYYDISFDTTDNIKSSGNYRDFVSGYAQENVFEDFAETFLMYIKYGSELRDLIVDNNELERKYVFIRDNVFDGYEFDIDKSPSESYLKLFNKDSERPFDISVVHRKV